METVLVVQATPEASDNLLYVRVTFVPGGVRIVKSSEVVFNELHPEPSLISHEYVAPGTVVPVIVTVWF